LKKKTIQTLTTTYVEFKKSGYEDQEHDLSQDTKNDKKAHASRNFTELIHNEEERKIFEAYCGENVAKNRIECLFRILEYEKLKDAKILNEIFEKFVWEEATQPFSLNDDIIEPMILKHQSKDYTWVDDVKKWICDTLNFELYPRFINSKVWKDYISSQFSSEQSNFEEKYEITKVDKDLSTISSSVQILSVRHQITNENFKAKKIKTATALSKKESLLYLDFPKHENLIHLLEILKEDNEVYKETTLFVITNDTPLSIDKFIRDLKSSNEFLSQLVRIFFQI
jgi:hypothetical protein